MSSKSRWTCNLCGKLNGPALARCCGCGEIKGSILPAVDMPPEVQRKVRRPDAIILTTAPTLAGHHITETIDVITAECVFGVNIFRDMFAGLRDIFGGRSAATQNVLRDARKTALTELRKEALLVDADAVIAVDLDYSEISGGGKSMLFLVASGTAVKVSPTTPTTHQTPESPG